MGESYYVLRIRLRRTGAKKQPRYRVVVAESRAPRDGAFVEVLGWYNPQADPAQVVVNTDKAAEWIARGAQPSDRVSYLLKRAGLGAAPETPPAEPEKAALKPARRSTATRARSSRTTSKAASPAASDAPAAEASAETESA